MTAETFLWAREAALDALERWAKAEARVQGLWLQGSLATDEADAFSDIDAYVAVDDASLAGLWAERSKVLKKLGGPLVWSDATAPGLKAVHGLMKGGARLDLFFEPASAVDDVARPPVRLLLDKADLATRLRGGWAAPVAVIGRQIQTIIRMTRQGATWPLRVIGRGQWSTAAMMELNLINAQVAQLMAVVHDPANFYKNPFSLALALSSEERARLDTLTAEALAAVAEREPAALMTAHLKVFDALVEEGRRACAALGVDYPIPAAREAEIRELLERAWPM